VTRPNKPLQPTSGAEETGAIREWVGAPLAAERQAFGRQNSMDETTHERADSPCVLEQTGSQWRSAFLGYWLIWVLVTLLQGRRPRFVPYPDMVPYPWFGVIATCGLLGAATIALKRMLCPRKGGLRWGHVAIAFLFAMTLFVGSVAAVPSDVPGYFYVPALYGLTTTISVLPLGAVMVSQSRHGRES